MSIYHYINANYFNPLKSLPIKWYYKNKTIFKDHKNIERKHHIVVSLTSFPARLSTVHYAIKSILNQSIKPDIIFVSLTKEEVQNESNLPESLLELKKHGTNINFADNNLKPHNKYLHAREMYPNSLIITIDDDNIYDTSLISDLYNSFLKHPNAISARRVHKIKLDNNGNLLPYNDWYYEFKKETKPSMSLLATGVGGVLYPPDLLPKETFDIVKIKELCLNADDIWLKFMQLKNNIPVVWVKGKKIHPYTIKSAQKVSLLKSNYHQNVNDKYINDLQNYYGINLCNFSTS